MLKAYRDHVAERAALGIPPLPLDAKQVAELIELIKNPPAGEEAFLLDLLTHRVPPGVDDAAKVKASFLAAVAHGDIKVGLISKAKATELLGTMVGGYNVHPLIELLADLQIPLAKLLHGEQSFSYHRPACVGDTVTVRSTIGDIYDKKNGALEFVVKTSRATNQRNELVAELRTVIVCRN